MSHSKKTIVLFLTMLFAGPAMLMASGRDFQLSLDCDPGAGGAWAGHTMPYVIGFKNNDFEQNYKVNYKTLLQGPNHWQMELAADGLVLGAGQVVKIEQKLGLPRNIAAGKYTILIKAGNDAMSAFDSCEFRVNDSQ